MCGIVGYVGPKQAAPIILDGLEKLEYRGYDSAGLATLNEGKLRVEKCKGRLEKLVEQTQRGAALPGRIGIGHTRWATHGEPSDRNSHPHLSKNGRFAVVHNGIIENYQELREQLNQKGYEFVSETDSEVIAHLVEYYDRGDMVDTLLHVTNRLQGSYAIGVVSAECPDRIFCCRKDAPLIVGTGLGENYFASDIPALLQRTRDCYIMEDDEIAELTAEHIDFYDIDRRRIHKEIFHVQWDINAAEKGGYEHFMMKEIMEQPKALTETLRPRIRDGHIVPDEIVFTEEQIQKLRHIYLVGCGSAYHVGMLGKEAIERLVGIPASADIASEFRYRNPILGPEDVVILISQSGETADTAAAMRLAKSRGARTIALVNVIGSTIAREADDVFYIWAGPEISVATTKAYSCQAAALSLLAIYFGVRRGVITAEQEWRYCADFLKLPQAFEKMLETQSDMQRYASQMYYQKDIYFVGRAMDYALSLEGSLKLKEISYIHSEATPAGELKHGPISLIEEGTLVIALATWEELIDKMFSNIREIETRGAEMLVITTEPERERMSAIRGTVLAIPTGLCPLLQALPAIVPLQFLAYYVAVLRGCDVDKPRNLAKSVTVE